MGLFGKSGLQGPPTRVALPLRDIQLRLSKGATGVPYSQHGTLWQARGGPQDLETIRAGGNQALRAVPAAVGRLGVDGFWVRDYGWGVRVGRPLGARWKSPVT